MNISWLLLFFCLTGQLAFATKSHVNDACRNKYTVNRMYCIDNRQGKARTTCLKEEKKNYNKCTKKGSKGGIKGRNYLVFTKGVANIYRQMNTAAQRKCIPKNKLTRIIVTLNEQTKIVNMNVGQELELVLAANPTSGFTWIFDKESISCLYFVREKYTVKKQQDQTIGGNGQMRFLFKAIEQCNIPAKIKLSYKRPIDIGSQVAQYTKEVTVDVQDNTADQIVDMSKKSRPFAKLQVDQIVKITLPANPTTGYIWHVDSSKAPCLTPIRQQYIEDDQGDYEFSISRNGQMNYWFQAKYLCANQYIGFAYEPEWSFDGFTDQNTREIRVQIKNDEQKIVLFDIDSVEGDGPFYVEMQYGSTLHVAANADPLSGFSWTLLPQENQDDPFCLKILRRTFMADDESNTSGGGRENFVLRALRPCKQEINMAYMGSGAYNEGTSSIQKRRKIRLTVVKRARTTQERCRDLVECQKRVRQSFEICAVKFEKTAQEFQSHKNETSAQSIGSCFKDSMEKYKLCVKSLAETVAPEIRQEQKQAENISRTNKPIEIPQREITVNIIKSVSEEIKVEPKTEKDPFKVKVEASIDLDVKVAENSDEYDFDNW